MTAPPGNKNHTNTQRALVGNAVELWAGVLTASTADGASIGGFVCPPGRRFAVRQAIVFVGTRATATATGTSAAILDIEIVPAGTAAGSGTNLNDGADNTGVKVGSSADSDISAAGKMAAFTIDDDDTTGINILKAGDRLLVESSGTLTGLDGCHIYVRLEELPPYAGS